MYLGKFDVIVSRPAAAGKWERTKRDCNQVGWPDRPMADPVATLPLPHSKNLLIINQYNYAEGACARNAPTKLPI